MKYYHHLKKKWNVRSDAQFWLIMLVFAITGTSVLFTRPIIFEFLGIHDELHFFLYGLLYVLVITPVYFVSLLIIGSLFGQYRFFNRFISRIFIRK